MLYSRRCWWLKRWLKVGTYILQQPPLGKRKVLPAFAYVGITREEGRNPCEETLQRREGQLRSPPLGRVWASPCCQGRRSCWGKEGESLNPPHS